MAQLNIHLEAASREGGYAEAKAAFNAVVDALEAAGFKATGVGQGSDATIGGYTFHVADRAVLERHAQATAEPEAASEPEPEPEPEPVKKVRPAKKAKEEAAPA